MLVMWFGEVRSCYSYRKFKHLPRQNTSHSFYNAYIQVGTQLILTCKLGHRLLRPDNATFRCVDEDTWDGGELAILRQKCVKVRLRKQFRSRFQ